MFLLLCLCFWRYIQHISLYVGLCSRACVFVIILYPYPRACLGTRGCLCLLWIFVYLYSVGIIMFAYKGEEEEVEEVEEEGVVVHSGGNFTSAFIGHLR